MDSILIPPQPSRESQRYFKLPHLPRAPDFDTPVAICLPTMSSRASVPSGRPGEVRFDSFSDASAQAAFGSSNPGSGTASPFTPSDSSKDAESGSQLLRRLSLKEVLTMRASDFQEQYPSLNLTGRIISAAFCIPHKLYFRAGSDWVSIFS